MLASAAISALVNLLLLAGIPFLIYFSYQKGHLKRSSAEIRQRAGLQLGEVQYLWYCLAFAFAAVAFLAIWPPPIEPFLRPGSPQQTFQGLGFSRNALSLALLYGVVKTGFPEELLFRGLIAGSLSRRFSVASANIGQALVFLLPHLLVLRVMPELWGILPIIFLSSLFLGWARIKSGSILGTWLVHASANVAICLSVAIRTTR